MKTLTITTLLLACLILTGFANSNEKKYCIEFSKKGEHKVILKESKQIAFALIADSVKQNGELKKIAIDSVTIATKNDKTIKIGRAHV